MHALSKAPAPPDQRRTNNVWRGSPIMTYTKSRYITTSRQTAEVIISAPHAIESAMNSNNRDGARAFQSDMGRISTSGHERTASYGLLWEKWHYMFKNVAVARIVCALSVDPPGQAFCSPQTVIVGSIDTQPSSEDHFSQDVGRRQAGM
jgi:hypothetical protein